MLLELRYGNLDLDEACDAVHVDAVRHDAGVVELVPGNYSGD